MTRRSESVAAAEQAVVLFLDTLPPSMHHSAECVMRAWLDGFSDDDLVGRNPTDLAGAARALWKTLSHPSGPAPRIRVEDPAADTHGWSSAHTVLTVVNDDMPFLVDSVGMELGRRGLNIHLFVHPVLRVQRDAEGIPAEVGKEDAPLESLMYIELDRLGDAAARAGLAQGIAAVLADVRAVVADWPGMRQRICDIAGGLPTDAAEADETRALLDWLLADNFVLLGCRDYRLVGEGARLDIVPGSGLGVLRERAGEVASTGFAALPEAVRSRAVEAPLLTITKSASRATVHRAGHADHIAVRSLDARGHVTGERRILGLFASTAYSASPWNIPVLRRKVEAVVARAGLLRGSHADKALRVILERYPRDELFQIDADTLFEHAIGILRLGERQRTRLFLRYDPFGRFVSALVYAPREHYDTEQRKRMQAVLMEAFDGVSSEFDVELSDTPLARLLFTIRTRGEIPRHDPGEVEQRIVAAARRWQDALREALVARFGETRGLALLARWGESFPAGYRERADIAEALVDIEHLDGLSGSGEIGLHLFRPPAGTGAQLRFKLYRADTPASLSCSLRILERMGVVVTDEQPTQLLHADGSRAWIHDFGLDVPADVLPDVERLRSLFEEAFRRIWHGDADNDEFNRLSLLACLGWREVAVLRAYARYMRQATFPFSQAYIEQALGAHPRIARALVALFVRRFDPAGGEGRDTDCEHIRSQIERELEAVQSLDEDRTLRQFLALILATLRTNWFARTGDGEPRPVLAFKLDPRAVPGLPEPRPMFEIFVLSPRVEGVHLRGGKVARGGLRWSDRMEDFRTEVLGLVKAQIVKNAVIVPVGSKGGFVVRNPPSEGGREAFQAEGLACYRLFLSGLLDLTDNLVDGEVVPPAGVVRHDGDDPYLVVAADKGTATFSDHANAIAAEYGFWLGDAFASGGSAGYDHKKMGITARGAWESVKRHFRAIGRDIQRDDFSVVGIGDMSGDVFGNGMLLSRHIRLVAAFDHRHVFLDPDPDVGRSWEERARLFALPRSSWDDYDKSLISAGGSVWPRSAKSVPLSPEVRALLGVEAERLTPAELVRAVLCAPVDLLYNGGIGTYVKAAVEGDAEVGDRANDAVRVNGADLRCKVVGEGGNLGFTQRGRIEYALAGGRIFTDAIDNSGGVDCSDHEVNIKILLGEVVRAGALGCEGRDVLLAEMTEEVARLVLRDNYGQGQVLEMMETGASRVLDEQAATLRRLAHAGRLNRKLEFLPLDEELAERRAAGQGLVAPELAVLLAYAKIELYDEVLASDVPDDAGVSGALWRYFPQPLRERFPEAIGRHPLRREIVATQVVNGMVNRVGASFVDRIRDETGHAAPQVVRAWLAVRDIFALIPVWREIEALDNQVPSARQNAMLIEALKLSRSATLWLLRAPRWLGEVAATVEAFGPGVARLAAVLPDLLDASEYELLTAAAAEHAADGVPQALAQRVASLHWLRPALDIVELAREHGRDESTVGRLYFAVCTALDLSWIATQIDALHSDARWPTLARGALRMDLATEARRLVERALGCGGDAESCVAAFVETGGERLARYRALVTEARGSTPDVASLSVLLRELRGLA
jgi:glutamate dehydrogenase